MATRINLITNPSFTVDAAYWVFLGSGVTTARITSDSYYGAGCLEVTKAGVSNSGARTTPTAPVVASLPYAVGIYIKIDSDQENGAFQVNVDWYNVSSSYISTSSTALTTVYAGNDWVRLAGLFTSPALATGAVVSIVQPTAGTTGKKFKIDAVLLEQSSYLGFYFEMATIAAEMQYLNKALSPLEFPKLTGLVLNADIALGNLILNTIDENGNIWVCTDIGGWWNPPAPEIPDFKRGWFDGSYDVKGRYNARDLTLTGTILTQDITYVALARDKLIKAIDLVHKGAWLRATELDGTIKSCYVRLSGQPEIQTVNARGKTTFSVGLRAGDPIKYEWFEPSADGYRVQNIPCKSSSPLATGAATITNSGNYMVATYLEVTGPLTGPATIKNLTNGDSLTILSPLRPYTTKTINNRGLIDSLVTIGTTTAHGLVPGDAVTISGLGTPYNGIQIVLSVIGTPATSTQFTYQATGANVTYGTASGSLSYGPDFLEIDTYNKLVYLNGNFSGARAKLDVYVDWTTLIPGNNSILFQDNGQTAGSTATLNVLYKSGWIA